MNGKSAVRVLDRKRTANLAYLCACLLIAWIIGFNALWLHRYGFQGAAPIGFQLVGGGVCIAFVVSAIVFAYWSDFRS